MGLSNVLDQELAFLAAAAALVSHDNVLEIDINITEGKFGYPENRT
jgi:hypothetical protein